MGNTGASIILIVVTSLFISSFLISWFALQSYGLNLDYVSLPNQLPTFSQEQDFSTNNINSSIIISEDGATWTYFNGIGKVLIGLPLTLTAHLYIDNIVSDSNGIIKNTYYINNSAVNIAGLHGDYGIIVKHTNGNGELRIFIEGNGFSLPNYGEYAVYIGEQDFIPYPNANQITDVVITTEYNQNLNTLSITFNNEKFTFDNMKSPSSDTLFRNYYGGVMSEQLGFTLKKFVSNNPITTEQTTDAIKLTSSLLVSMLKIVSYQFPTYILPIELQFLFIAPQEAALIIGIAAFIRGT